MHWCISPAFVEKATQFVQILEILRIGLTPPKVQARNLKNRPKVAQVIWIFQVRKLILATDFRRVNIGIFNEEPQGGVWMEIGGIGSNEGGGCLPKGRNRFVILVHCHDEAVYFVVCPHEGEDITIVSVGYRDITSRLSNSIPCQVRCANTSQNPPTGGVDRRIQNCN